MLAEEVLKEFKEAASITKRVVGNWMKPTLGFLNQIGNLYYALAAKYIITQLVCGKMMSLRIPGKKHVCRDYSDVRRLECCRSRAIFPVPS